MPGPPVQLSRPARTKERSDGRASQRAAAIDPAETVENAAARIDSLWAHLHREVVRIAIDSVGWIEAEGDYVRLHTPDGGGLVRMTLTALEAQRDHWAEAQADRRAGRLARQWR